MNALFLLAASFLLRASPQTQAPVSGIVQVAVNYGPQQNVFLSGVVIGNGSIILTDSGVLDQAHEITIAYADGEFFDVLMPRTQLQNHLAALSIPEKH